MRQHFIPILNRSAGLFQFVKANRCVLTRGGFDVHPSSLPSPSLSLSDAFEAKRHCNQYTLPARVKQIRSVFTKSHDLKAPLRRLRPPFGSKYVPPTERPIDFGDLELPYEYGDGNVDDYLKSASLSPWVPMPDSAARKIMDLVGAESSDFHVDLGKNQNITK
jgi:hypothetical protein